MKKKAIAVTLLFFLIILLTGCGGLPKIWEHTVKIDDLGDVPNGKARIVFFTPKVAGGNVFDATNGDLILLGHPLGGEGIVQDIEPGEYLFMVNSENADFMHATLEPNRTYYALIQWRFGVAFTRYGLWPIRNGSQGDYPFESEQVQSWLKNIDYVKPHEKYLSFWGRERFMRGYQKQRDKYWPKWQEKSSEDKLRRTLLPEDGISTTHYSKQNTQITQGVRTEPNTAQSSLHKQTEIRTSAAENSKPEPDPDPDPTPVPVAVAEPEPVSSISPSNTSELQALMTLRDDGIISEDEFQKQKTKILASTQRVQTSVQSIPRIEEVDHAEIGNIVGDSPSKNHNSSTSGDISNQQSQGVASQSSEKSLYEQAPEADKGNSKQATDHQNNSGEVKKTEWVRDIGGRKLYCVRTADQTICQ